VERVRAAGFQRLPRRLRGVDDAGVRAGHHAGRHEPARCPG
jgi:hypothetical protein